MKLMRMAALIAALAAVIVAGCAGQAPSPNIQGSSVALGGIGRQEGIWVDGLGQVSGAPDVAIVSLGVQSRAGTVAEAQTRAAGAMSAIMSALKSKGVRDQDIQTTSFSVSPVTQVEKDGTPRILGYQVSNMVVAKVRDLSAAGPVIDAAVQAGGDLTRVNGISFTIDDPSALQAQAQKLALQDALAKAKSTAETLGVRLGKLTYVQTGVQSPISPQRGLAAAAPFPETPISPGLLTITATAQASWEIQ